MNIKTTVNLAVLHLAPEKELECIQLIESNKELAIKAKAGKIYPVKVYLRHYLGLNKLPRGTSTLALKFWTLRGWSEEMARERINSQTSKIDYKKFSPFSKECTKYSGLSEEEKTKLIKSKRPCTAEYWEAKGFTSKDAQIKALQHQQNASLIGNSNYASDRTSTQIGYWLKRGCTREEAILNVKERNKVCSLESYTARLGVMKGALRYLRNIATDRFSLKRKAIVMALWECRKIKKVEDIELFFELLKKHHKVITSAARGHASLESLLFFLPVYEHLRENYTCMLGLNNHKEFSLQRSNGRKFRYDFCIEELKLIFEYDGVYFHKEALPTDSEKYALAEAHGYTIVRLQGLKNWGDYSVGKSNIEKILFILNEKGVIITKSDIMSNFIYRCLSK